MLPLETWVSIGTLLGTVVALYLALRHESRELRAELKADMRDMEGRVTGRINELDRRVHELAAGLRPYVEGVQRSEESRRA